MKRATTGSASARWSCWVGKRSKNKNIIKSVRCGGVRKWPSCPSCLAAPLPLLLLLPLRLRQVKADYTSPSPIASLSPTRNRNRTRTRTCGHVNWRLALVSRRVAFGRLGLGAAVLFEGGKNYYHQKNKSKNVVVIFGRIKNIVIILKTTFY